MGGDIRSSETTPSPTRSDAKQKRELKNDYFGANVPMHAVIPRRTDPQEWLQGIYIMLARVVIPKPVQSVTERKL